MAVYYVTDINIFTPDILEKVITILHGGEEILCANELIEGGEIFTADRFRREIALEELWDDLDREGLMLSKPDPLVMRQKFGWYAIGADEVCHFIRNGLGRHFLIGGKTYLYLAEGALFLLWIQTKEKLSEEIVEAIQAEMHRQYAFIKCREDK